MAKRAGGPRCRAAASTRTLAERSRGATALARFQAAVRPRAGHLDASSPCKALTRPICSSRDCVVVALLLVTRFSLRLPALGADKAAVLADCEKIPADFTETA